MGILKKSALQALGFLFLFLFLASNTVQADTAFLRQLADKPVASFADAVLVVTQFLNQGTVTQYSDFEAQKNFLNDKGVLSKRLADKKAEDVIRNGDLAEIVIKTLGIRGGLMLRSVRLWNENLLGRYFFQRYALREAIFLRLMKDDEDSRSFVSGLELISTVSKMSEYRSGEE